MREEASDYAERSSLINVRSRYHVVNMIAQFLISTQSREALFAWDYSRNARSPAAPGLIIYSERNERARLLSIALPGNCYIGPFNGARDYLPSGFRSLSFARCWLLMALETMTAPPLFYTMLQN